MAQPFMVWVTPEISWCGYTRNEEAASAASKFGPFQCASGLDDCFIFRIRFSVAAAAPAITFSATSAQRCHRSAKLVYVARLAGSFVERAIARHSCAFLRNASTQSMDSVLSSVPDEDSK
jgi:hypothetical protein